MNKFQKVACKMAKLERDSGRLALTNSLRLEHNKKYGTKLKAKSFRDVKNSWYHAMERNDISNIQSAYHYLDTARKLIEHAKNLKMF